MQLLRPLGLVLFALLSLSLGSGAGTASPVPAAASASLTMDVNSSVQQAIQAVIQQGNSAQQQAFSQNNPAVMRDTATADYYRQLVQINRDLQNNGVTAIALLNLRWGPISQVGANLWQATTFETWRTTFDDGSIEQSTDRNVYSVVQQNGSWKIQSDQHPDSAVEVPAPPPSPGQPGPALPSGQSFNWAGYQATGGTFTGVSGSWTVPASSSLSFAASATWVGIGGVQSRDLIQAGTQSTDSGPGQTQYSAWIEMLPRASRPVPVTVHAGDSMAVSLSQQAADQWLIDFRNNTTGQRYQQTVRYNSSGSSAEWIEEAPTSLRGLLPLDNFGAVNFGGATAQRDGKSLTAAAAGAQPLNMVSTDGQLLASTSGLGADGASFSVTRSSLQPAPLPFPVAVPPISVEVG